MTAAAGLDEATRRRRSPALDALRGAAACLVVVAHASRLGLPRGERAHWSPPLVFLGQAGVVLFFVLSGYLIGGMWVRRNRSAPRLRSYAARRVLRIWPAYALAYAATVVLVHPASVEGAGQWAVHLLLLHNWVPGEFVAVFPVGWTLGIEAMFYLVAPSLPRSVRGVVTVWVASATLALAAALAFGSTAGTSGWVGPARFSLPAMLCLFCPGILVALRPPALVALARRPATALAVMTAATATALALCYRTTAWVHDLHYQALAVAAGVLLLLVVEHRSVPHHVAARIAVRALAAVGVVSYGLYLWHNTLMALLLDAGVTTTGWGTGVLLLFAVSLPVAVASWFAVERPALKLAARISGEGTRDRDLPHRRPGELIGSGRSS